MAARIHPQPAENGRITLRFLSLFSGIEAASCAWVPLGWECVGVSEIEPFPCSLLRHHYPDVPNLGDITKITEEQIRALGRIDLIVGGFPCQDVSIAGKQQGLQNADGTPTRSGLFFDAMRIVEWVKPRWTVIENVPGLLGNRSGRDFAAVVGALAGTGVNVPKEGWRNTGVVAGRHGLVEWTVLDAQWRGLAQRRKRVFLVRDSGDWQRRPPVLIESESLCGNPPPRREAGKGVAGTISARTQGGGGLGTDFELDGGIIAYSIQERAVSDSETSGPQGKGWQEGIAFTLEARNKVQAVAFNHQAGGSMAMIGYDPESDITSTLSSNQTPAIHHRHGIRRLTPLECERLQGFDDNYTLIPHRGKPAADGPRYKAIGNSMAVPVMRWIGERIMAAENYQ